MIYVLVFLAGVIFAAVVGFWGMRFYLKLKRRFGAPRWYEVASFLTEPEADGVYLMDFRLGDSICKGYTKKCPPIGVQPEDLEVKIRTFCVKRCLYRVFWQFKNEKNTV